MLQEKGTDATNIEKLQNLYEMFRDVLLNTKRNGTKI